MKKNIIYAIVIVLVIIICSSTILMINNKNASNKQEEITNQSENNVPNKSEANNMTDDELVQKTISGEESLTLNSVEDDTIITNIDNILNEKDPLADMPGE